MFFDQSEFSGLQWKDFFEKIDSNKERESPSPTSLQPSSSVATLPFTKSICYGECPSEETQDLIIIKCYICKKLVKDVGYAYHMRARHGQRAESPSASMSGDDIQDFLLSPPHLPMIPSTSYSPFKNVNAEMSPPLSPRSFQNDTSNRIRSPPYYVEQRNDLVLRLTKRIPSRASNEESPVKTPTKLEECEVLVEPSIPKAKPIQKGRKKGGRGRKPKVVETDAKGIGTSFGFETELEESPLKNSVLQSDGRQGGLHKNLKLENVYDTDAIDIEPAAMKIVKQGVASKNLRARGRLKQDLYITEKLQEKFPVSLCSPSAEFSNSAISMDAPVTPATIRSSTNSNGKLSKSEVAKRSPVVESAKTASVENIGNSKLKQVKHATIRNLKFNEQQKEDQKPNEASKNIKTTAPQTELEIVQKLLGMPGIAVTASPAKLVGAERRTSTETPPKVETPTKEEAPALIDPIENKKIIMKKLQLLRNQMAQKQKQNLSSKSVYVRLHETTNATKTPSPSEQSTISEDSSSSSSLEGVELFDSKLEYDLVLANSGSLRSLISDQARKIPIFNRTPVSSCRPVSSVRPIVQIKTEESHEGKKAVKVTPFFRRGPSTATIRLPRHLLGSSGSSHEFRRLLSETAKAEMAQPLNLNPNPVGIKRIRRPLLNPIAVRPTSDQPPSQQHTPIPTRILKGIKVTTTPSVSSTPTELSSIDFKFPTRSLQGTPEPEIRTPIENGWPSASSQHLVSLPSAPGITVSVSVSDVPVSPSTTASTAPIHQPKIIPLSRCSTPTQQQPAPFNRVSRESTPAYIDGFPSNQRVNGMVYQNYARNEDNSSTNGMQHERVAYQQTNVQRRINAELAEQLHQQRMMMRAAQASGQILPYQIHESPSNDSLESSDQSMERDLPPEMERIPTLTAQQQDPRAYAKRSAEGHFMNEDPTQMFPTNKRMRIGLTKSASMRSTNQDYEPGQFDYRPPFRRVVRATTRPQRQSPQIYPVSMAHHNYASAPITPTDMTQSYYDQNQGFVNQMQEHANSNEYAEETNYMEHHQHQSIQMPSQRIPIYRPIVHKRAQGMAPMHQQQIRMPTDHRYIDMQGMEIQPNSSQAIFITSPSAAQPQFVPITNMNRRSVQMNHNIQQQQPQQPLMYIQPKPAGNLQQPVLFQINPMRNPPPTSFQFQPIEPPPVLQAEVCLPSDSQPTRSNQNVYSYNQQYYPQQQAPRQNTLPTLLPRRHPQNNGFVGVPASFPSSIQPTQFQFVLAPAAIPTPVLDMNSIPNITPNS